VEGPLLLSLSLSSMSCSREIPYAKSRNPFRKCEAFSQDSSAVCQRVQPHLSPSNLLVQRKVGSDLHGVNHGLDLLADAVGSHLHLFAEELCEAASAGREGELVLGALALGPPQVRRNLMYEKQGSVLKKVSAAEEGGYVSKGGLTATRAPLETRYLMVSTEARIRVSSVIFLPSRGTLRSQRISTCTKKRKVRTWDETVCLAPTIQICSAFLCPELSRKNHVTQL
jgi:hypothetical protein